MSDTALAPNSNAALLERVVLGGDLSKLTPTERLLYYTELCTSLKLNPLTQPFQYLNLSGRLVLYARKDATEQLRKQHGVSITKLEAMTTEGVYVVTAYAKDASGREDVATGAVAIENLKGESKANALLKAETKAKRRVTLSLCGLGMLDETEIETIPGAQVVELDADRVVAHAPSTTGGAAPALQVASTDTVEQEADRLFISPAAEERQEKVAVLERIANGFRLLKLTAAEQVATWDKHTNKAEPFLDPDATSLDALTMLLDELQARHRSQESRQGKR